MRVLIATDNYYPNVNGASYAAQRLAKAVAEQGIEVRVLAPARGFLPETFEHDGVTVQCVSSVPFERIRIPTPLAVGFEVSRAVRAYKPDVVHAESHFALGRHAVWAARRQGIPILETNHFMPENLTHYVPITDAGRRLLRWSMWRWCLSVLTCADQVTAPTHAAVGLLKEVGLRAPALVLSNGIDTERFNPRNDATAVRAHYKLGDEPILLYVGRLDLEKNLNAVIRAFARAVKKAPFRLVLAGTGAESENLKKRASSLGIADKVQFTGFIPDDELPALYAAADAFVMAGTAELQSLVTMEAMATGLPVIAVDAVALPELVHDGKNGFLFKDGDIAAMQRAMETLFTDSELRKRMGQESLAIIARHAMPLVMKEVVGLYEQLRSQARG